MLLDQPFTAGRGWVKDLTIRVRNTSEKEIAAVALQIRFPHASAQNGFGFILMQGKVGGRRFGTDDGAPPHPGESVDLRMPEADYLLFEKHLAAKGLADELTTLHIHRVRVHFSDGRTWLGDLLNPNAPGPDK